MFITRRDFLKTSAASALAFSAPNILTAAKTQTPYRTALIGSGWWGMKIARFAVQSGQCRFVAICDVDSNQLDPAVKEIEQLTGHKPKGYKDYRELLAAEKPQIVIVATPDHWHGLPAIAAMKAGADVYLEKPIGHTVYEGSAMVKTARDTGRVVQVGLHRRLAPHHISAMKFLKAGKAGKIGMVRTFAHYGGGAGKVTPDSETPEGLDWDMWCGPGPLRPYNKKIHPRGFRMFLDYANGQLGDWGIHWLDQVLWWTEEKYPKTVYSTGARHIKEDNTDAPDTQVVTYEFESFTATWEHRQYAANKNEKHNVGCYFYGTEGVLHLGWLDGWTFYPLGRGKQDIHEDPKLHQPGGHNIPESWADFMDAIKTRRQPVCNIEVAHRSTNMSLLGMLSYKLGRSIKWDGRKEVIIGDPKANKLLSREYRKPWKYPRA